ncbi:hypothetical protein N7533_000026, partial [Penicillium manginii]|uniref:uncharacterized protein n=1 Tax=Penicillium manginii TaxID=203109 RepID=UPI0025479E3E
PRSVEKIVNVGVQGPSIQTFENMEKSPARPLWAPNEGYDGLMSSLCAFFGNFKYLESCVHFLSQANLKPVDSVGKSASGKNHPEEGGCIIQTSVSKLRCLRATEAEYLETRYENLWLHTMRHYFLMPSDPKNNDYLPVKLTRARPDPRTIYDIAYLAH